MTRRTGSDDAGPVLRRPDIVVVASSTGGPKALGAFLAGFSAPPPVPMVIVQHMPDSFTGRLAGRLDGLGAYTVGEASAGAALAAGRALVAPGGRHLRWRRGRIELSAEPPVGGLRPRADLTIADLVSAFGGGVCAVVLTGMGEDGLAGCRAVVEAGGQVLAQDRRSAVVDGMPRRVRDAGLAQVVGPPGQLARALERAWRRPVGLPTPTGPTGSPGTTGTPPRSAARPRLRGDGAVDPPSPEVLDRVVDLLARFERLDAGSVRRVHLARRVHGFCRTRGIEPERLAVGLTSDAGLRHELVNALTVNVTAFFRDPDRWRDLERLVVPDLAPGARVWCAACADGSEVYSLAMMLAEHGVRGARLLGTDIDDGVVRRARRGNYGARQIRNVPPALLERYFVRQADGWMVAPTMRRRVVFARHDALSGRSPTGSPDPRPPDGVPVGPPFDLVVCRNLAIYLTDEARSQLFARLTGAMSPGGRLFLGRADSLIDPAAWGLTQISSGLFRLAPRPVAGPVDLEGVSA